MPVAARRPGAGLVLADIKEAIEALDITGKRSSEDILQAISSRFCIGK